MNEAVGARWLLICTVGGSPDPVAFSIKHWNPARLFLVASPQTKELPDRLRDEVDRLPPGTWDILEINDAEDFGGCVRRMRTLDEGVSNWRRKGPEYGVIADFTGGTKCMSAALAAVARRWPCRFSYIGGAERDKSGVGIVMPGRERALYSQNPWDDLGYQAIEDACLLFDQHTFDAAAAMLERVKRATDDPGVKRQLSTFEHLCRGYGHWDRFQHRNARSSFNNTLAGESDLRVALGERAERLRDQIRIHLQILEGLSASAASRLKVADLIGNARRRHSEGRYDDAVARLYRAIEAIAQLALAERYGIASTNKVPLEALPERLAMEWAARVKGGEVFLGLQDAYRLLVELGDETGKLFRTLNLDKREGSPLCSRNQSILAHGFDPVSGRIFDQLLEAALQLGGFSNHDIPEFPRLTARN